MMESVQPLLLKSSWVRNKLYMHPIGVDGRWFVCKQRTELRL